MSQSFPSSLLPVLGVVAVMALLTKGCQIQKTRGLWCPVKHMGRSQNNRTPCYRMRKSVSCAAPFALVLGPVMPHKPASQFPICWIACFVLGPYRHIYFPELSSTSTGSALSTSSRCRHSFRFGHGSFGAIGAMRPLQMSLPATASYRMPMTGLP